MVSDLPSRGPSRSFCAEASAARARFSRRQDLRGTWDCVKRLKAVGIDVDVRKVP